MFDVVISGAGPNGLMLACELALSGVRPLIIEKLTGPSEEQRANGMVGQVIRVLDRRGLLERLTGKSKPPDPAPEFMFAAFPLPLSDLPDNPVYTVLVPQRRIEEMLAGRAAELGVEIRRGHEVTGVTQKDDRVLVEVDGDQILEARFLVGADGGKSITRKLAGIDFPGLTNDKTVSRTFEVEIPRKLIGKNGLDIPGYGFIPAFLHHRNERGLISFAPFPDGRKMISVSTRDIPEPDAPYAFGEFREALDYVLGTDVPVTEPAVPRLKRRLSGGNTRLAATYRAGRILLVGDAAHVHSAIGGPGLNLGLQDAVNLGWKLAATVRETAPAGLLDTYESERRPVAERVIMQTKAQSVLIGPGPEVTALRTLFGELLEEPAVRQRIAGLISGADVRYDLGDRHPLSGYFAPGDVPMHAGRPLLIDPAGKLARTAAPWLDRVDLVRSGTSPAMLIRPDGYVAWASDSGDSGDKGLKDALKRWFG
jgi:2-polyprenyl-6-methoxyphenol hydroxylase-like FAD-dependent oxidoreductase